ncbi:MAG TPA: prenyltransferase [Methanomassiliicoccales archaeon]|jgi:4-hydroxybenzoate polyprenyltransferase
MKPVSLFYFARIKPMAAWTISGSLLGVALAGYLTGWHIIDGFSTFLAAIVVVLMQYVAHPMNDIMDYELDRQAPIEATGRVKPLVDGMITRKETKWLSLSIVLLIVVIMAYLIWLRPVLILPAAYGMAALIGYNHKATKLAYRPYSELYISMPINAIAVFVISYIGSGQLSQVATVVGVCFGFASSSFFVSMMSMDFPTDRENGKRTTIVTHPRLRWCMYYPLTGLFFTIVSAPLIMDALPPFPAAAFLGVTVVVFALLALLGSKVDRIRLDYLAGRTSNMEGATGAGRLYQLYLSVVYALSLAALFAYLRM